MAAAFVHDVGDPCVVHVAEKTFVGGAARHETPGVPHQSPMNGLGLGHVERVDDLLHGRAGDAPWVKLAERIEVFSETGNPIGDFIADEHFFSWQGWSPHLAMR